MPKNIPSGNIIYINNKTKVQGKATCKELYWHMIDTYRHMPTVMQKWSDHYQNYNTTVTNIQPGIFELLF